jgi:hypothetical protein
VTDLESIRTETWYHVYNISQETTITVLAPIRVLPDEQWLPMFARDEDFLPHSQNIKA